MNRNVLAHARIPVIIAALAALAGCSAGATAPAATSDLPVAIATSHAGEPAWGKGGVGAVEDLQPALRPDASANERLADRMAAAVPWHWTGTQAACLNEAWARISDWDNFFADDLYNGIAGLAGHVADPAMPADPTMRQEQAAGWFDAEPHIQVAAGLVDIWIFWGSPCGEWAYGRHDTPGTYPLWTNITDPGWHGEAGRLNFDITGSRLALDPETLYGLCGVPGEPAAFPPPACAHITQATTWPLS